MVRIRKASWNDSPSIASLYADLEWEKYEVSAISRFEALKRALHIIAHRDEYYVAEEENQIVGMMCLITSQKIRYLDSKLFKKIELKGGCIWDGFVKKEHRRHKIGSLLLTRIEEDAKQIGLPYLYTIPSSPAAIELIKKMSYVEVGTELISEKLLGYPLNYKMFCKELI